VFSIGGEWQNDRLTASFELSSSNSDTVSPNLSTTLNFINPNCPLDGSSNDNCVPFIYDLSGGTLSFGVNYDSPFAPDPSDLLDPANVVLDQVSVDRNTNENSEDALRLDFSYELDWKSVSSVDFGYRYNESSSKFEDIGDRIGGFSKMVDSPNGTMFSELLVAGPTNYNAGDGRDLYIRNFLLLDPDRSFSDPEGTIAILQNAVIAHDPDSPDILNLQSSENAFYDVSEETSALYGQVNFEHGIFRGNLGLRWIETEVDSVAFGPADANGVRSLTSTKGKYDFVLPRLNVVATVRDDLLVRMGYGSDIRRPGFNNLNTGFTFDPSENASVSLGNPGLEPEEVDSFDISAEWYFAPSAVVSVGYFTKDRTNIFGQDFEGALLTPSDEFFADGFVRETDPSCPGGGIFNPEVVPNVLGDPAQTGMCVDFTQPGNDPATTTQSGIELAFQYDLSSFEDSLGWASGFGVIANYTKQDFKGGSEVDTTSGRGLTVLGDVSIERGLLDFSEDAYNFTVFYEKYGVSARMRYTWREGFRTNDFAGGANTSGSSTFSFPVHTLDRGQLNASINYDVNDQLNIGLEVVNLTEEGIDQHCVSETGPLCFVGIPDRRITAGVSYRF
jgi:TonB-dependent receptor